MTNEELECLTPWSVEAKDHCSRSLEEEVEKDVDIEA